MLRAGASQADWDRAVALAHNYWPGWYDGFGASPGAVTYAIAAWCHWLQGHSNRDAENAILAADAIGGDPVLLHVFASMGSEESDAVAERMRAMGVEPINIVNEACHSLRSCSAWTLVRTVHAIKGVAEEQHTALIRDAIALPLVGKAGLDGSGAELLITKRIGEFAGDLLAAIDVPTLDQCLLVGGGGDARLPAAARYIDGQLADADMLSLDAAFGDLLRRIGVHGARWADDLEKRSRDRMKAARDVMSGRLSDEGRALGFTTLPPSMSRREVRTLGFDRVPWDQLGPLFGTFVSADVAKHPLGMPWVNAVAWAYVEDEVRPDIERGSARVAIFQRLDYGKIPKAVHGIGWAVGGPPLRLPASTDGDQFGLTPSLACGVAEGRVFITRGAALLPSSERPHQTALPLAYDDAETMPIALMHASSAGVLSLDAYKIALLALSNPQVLSGKMMEGTIGEWVDHVRPFLSRAQARDRSAVAKGFHEIDALRLFLPDGTDLRPFDVRRPTNVDTPSRDAELSVGLTASFLKALGASFGVPAYRGEFLMNLSKTMALKGSDGARRARLYTSVCAHWGAAYHSERAKRGEFNARMMPAHSLERWGVLANSLSPPAIECLRGNGKSATRRAQLSKDRKRVVEDFEALRADGLVLLRKVRGELMPIPPEDHQDAFREIRRSGVRSR